MLSPIELHRGQTGRGPTKRDPREMGLYNRRESKGVSRDVGDPAALRAIELSNRLVFVLLALLACLLPADFFFYSQKNVFVHSLW